LGKCLAGDDGRKFCYYKKLDYGWCVGQFSHVKTHPFENPLIFPCGGTQRYATQEVESILQCISTMPCNALGLPFDYKRRSRSQRQLDLYRCTNTNAEVWTATVCDHGLLWYDQEAE
jgi:hypothetical protein